MNNKLTLISSVCIGGFSDTMVYNTLIEYQGKIWNIEVDKVWDNNKKKDLWKMETDLKLNYDTKKAIIKNISQDMPSIYYDVEPKQYNIDIFIEDKIKSLQGWNESEAKTLMDYLHIGDKVDRKLIDNLIDSLPPITLNGEIVQIGGAYSSDNKGRTTYITFARERPFGDWCYKGACIKGETINKEYEFEWFDVTDKSVQIEENRKLLKIADEVDREEVGFTELYERIPEDKRDNKLFYYECRTCGGETSIERKVSVDFSKTLVTDKEILGDKEYIDENELFNNSKYQMLDSSDVYDRVNDKLNNEVEDEEEEI